MRLTTDRLLSHDGTTIAFDRTGEGPAVILVGGAIQHRAIDASTARLAALLAEQFTVYHYDRRGRGDSGDTLPYAVEREVEDLDALVSEAGGSASVYGMSSGAALALDAAAHGVAIARLALYEPPFIVDDTRPPLPDDYVEQLDELAATGRPGDAVEYFMTKAVGVPAEFVAEMRRTPIWPALESVAHTLAYDGRIMAATVTDGSLANERWASVTGPILAMDGGDSQQWARNAVQALVDGLPGVERRTLAGQTHDVAVEVLAPELREFFAR